MSYNFRKYKLKLYPITPIHVGTGETISPGEYMYMKEKYEFASGNKFNILRVGDLPDAAEKSGKINTVLNYLKDSKTWLFKIHNDDKLREQFAKDYDYMMIVDSEEIAKKFEEKFYGNKYLEDQCLINTMLRNHKGIYIPGSSVKGAVRTGFSYMNYKSLADYKKRDADAENDLFKYIKISDTGAMEGQTKLYKTVHFGMGGKSEETEISDYREMSKYSFDCKVSFDFTVNIASHKFDIKKLLANVSDFYKDVMKYEKIYWEDTEGNDNISNLLNNFYDDLIDITEKNDNKYLIRLGWGIGKQAISLNIMADDDDYIDPITRKYIISDKKRLPLGWALIEIEDEIKL